MPRIGRRRRRNSLALAACALLAALLVSAPAMAADPTLGGSFDGTGTPARTMTATWLDVNTSTGDVYVVDTANDVLNVFSSDGTYQTQFLGSATTNGAFRFGGEDDVAVDNSSGPNRGNVYVNSESAGLVFAFDATGRFLWQSSASVTDLCGVGVDSAGHPWLADYANGLQQLDPADGSAVGSPILAGTESCHFAFDASDNVVLNHWHGVVERLDQAGTSLATIEPNAAYDVAVDQVSGVIYTDVSNVVTVHDATGASLGEFGLQTFATSRGVAVNGTNGKIYATDIDASPPTVFIYNAVRTHTLSVTVDGAGSGSVDADRGAISGCTSSGGTCSDSYDEGTTVTLAATPDSGSSFTGWTGCDSVVGDTCRVTLGADANVRATFDPIVQHTLRAAKSGSGSGTVRSSPAGIDCGGTCSALFDQGTAITLTATPAAHSTFTGWSGGGCSGTSTCRVTLNADTTVTATFAQDKPTVTTGAASSVTQTGATVAGTVNPNGSNVSDCHVEYGTSTSYGSQVACASLPGSGTSAANVSAALSGLTAGTTYHYRVVATNAGGATNGSDQTFTTQAVSQPPARTCATDPSLCPARTPGVLSLVGTTATLSGRAVPVKLTCTGDTACSVRVKLTAKLTVGRGKRRHKATVTIASKQVTIAAGQTSTVRFTLSKAARKALAGKHTLVTTLTAGDYRHTLVVKSPRRARRHHRK